MKKIIIGAVLIFLALVLLAVMIFGKLTESVSTPPQTQPETSSLATVPSSAPQTVPPTKPEPTWMTPAPERKITAKQYFVYDVLTDTFLEISGKESTRIYPASITKLFTCYVAMQYLEPGTVLTVGEEMKKVALGSSVARLVKGDQLTVAQLTAGMLLPSGNDAAYVLAVAAGRAIAENPSLDAQAALDIFMEEVNRQLKGNGILNTHFVTPDGYDAEGHQTTAEDLLKITKLAMTNSLILRYCAMEEAVVTYLSGQNYTWKNTNFLLRQEFEDFYNPYATGLKTGSTSKAGACVIATFEDGDRLLVIGILGCETVEQRFQDAQTLFEFYR